MSKLSNLIIGNKIADKLDRIARMPVATSVKSVTERVAISRELTQDARNRILWIASMVGVVVQIINGVAWWFLQ